MENDVRTPLPRMYKFGTLCLHVQMATLKQEWVLTLPNVTWGKGKTYIAITGFITDNSNDSKNPKFQLSIFIIITTRYLPATVPYILAIITLTIYYEIACLI